jgi:catechol 2,3-dioxygenase-like lactoylglutathione lyase family enzyme
LEHGTNEEAHMSRTESVLGGASPVAFVATSDLGRARAFYQDRLGLDLLETTPGADVLDAGGTVLRVTLVEQVVVAPYTVLGWSVPDIERAVDLAADAGVTFRRFDGMDQDDRGIWAAPGGDRVAWFEDPDGNLLSFTHHPGALL